VVGVVLSGNLNDGTAGLLRIKQRGGLAIVQDPQTALYQGMPRSAIEHVAVDHVLPVQEISALVAHLASRPAESLEEFLPRFDAQGRHAATPAELRSVCNAEEVIDRQLLAERARAGIDRLPELYREAFVLRDLEELSTVDVAEVLGVEPAAVRQRVHRARLMLRGYLGALTGVKP
jgi:RNA polymerase sigma factor (sigma-70 family)